MLRYLNHGFAKIETTIFDTYSFYDIKLVLFYYLTKNNLYDFSRCTIIYVLFMFRFTFDALWSESPVSTGNQQIAKSYRLCDLSSKSNTEYLITHFHNAEGFT